MPNREEVLSVQPISRHHSIYTVKDHVEEPPQAEPSESVSAFSFMNSIKIDARFAIAGVVLMMLGIFASIVTGVVTMQNTLNSHTETLKTLVPKVNETHDAMIEVRTTIRTWQNGPLQPVNASKPLQR